MLHVMFLKRMHISYSKRHIRDVLMEITKEKAYPLFHTCVRVFGCHKKMMLLECCENRQNPCASEGQSHLSNHVVCFLSL